MSGAHAPQNKQNISIIYTPQLSCWIEFDW
jgi:hypothetical protein